MGVIVSGGRSLVVRDSAYVQVRETITDVTRQIEDLTWVSMSNDTRGQNLDDLYDQRRLMLARIRIYRRRSPLAKQGSLLLQHYVLGQGISLRANNKAKVARIIDEFMNDPENVVTLTGHQAMSEFLDTVFTDGNFFIVLDVDDVLGMVRLKTIDVMYVEDVVTDPDNPKVPRWYKVRKPQGGYDFSVGRWTPTLADDFVYYRDWRNSRTDFAPPAAKIEPGLVYHVAINKRGKFGESELAAALDWLKAHKDFMEDRATIVHAAAQIAWVKKRKTGQAGIDAEVAKLRSSLTQNINAWENNPPAATGSTLVQNEGSALEWMKTDTGGANALADERIMRMMAGSGMGGIPNHYFGDEANANLATATSMELPLLKTYESWQQLLSTCLADLFEFVLGVAHDAGRIGERDDSRKYADKRTTPMSLMSMPDSSNAPATGPGLRETQADRLINVLDLVVAITESIHQEGNEWVVTSADGAKVLGRYGSKAAAQKRLAQVEMFKALKEAAGIREASGTTGPEAPVVQIELVPKTEPPSVVAADEDVTGAIDWYVGIDFPPIVQKDLNIYTAAIKALYEMMPASNIESQKLAVELVLQALGVDVEETMERIFPPELLSPKVVGAMAQMAQQLGPGSMNNPFADGSPQPVPPPRVGAPPGTRESGQPVSFAEARVRRVLRAAREASDALSVVGE